MPTFRAPSLPVPWALAKLLPLAVAALLASTPSLAGAEDPAPRTIVGSSPESKGVAITAGLTEGDFGDFELRVNYQATTGNPSQDILLNSLRPESAVIHLPGITQKTVMDYPNNEVFGVPAGEQVWGHQSGVNNDQLGLRISGRPMRYLVWSENPAQEPVGDGHVTFTLHNVVPPHPEAYLMASASNVWVTNGTGVSIVHWLSKNALPQDLSFWIAGESSTFLQTGAINWTYTHLGLYCLDIEANARLANGEYVSDRAWFALVVGPYEDVEHVRCGEHAGGGTGVSQTINVEVAPVEDGALTLSVTSEEPVVLPTPEFQDGFLVSQGSIHPVIVTDLRLANPGWDLNGQLSDFATGDDAHSFSPERLGWAPYVSPEPVAPAGVTAGDNVTPNAPGLSGSNSLGTASEGGGYGVSVLGAELTLELPTDQAPGSYSATLTLTVI